VPTLQWKWKWRRERKRLLPWWGEPSQMRSHGFFVAAEGRSWSALPNAFGYPNPARHDRSDTSHVSPGSRSKRSVLLAGEERQARRLRDLGGVGVARPRVNPSGRRRKLYSVCIGNGTFVPATIQGHWATTPRASRGATAAARSHSFVVALNYRRRCAIRALSYLACVKENANFLTLCWNRLATGDCCDTVRITTTN